MDLQKWLEHNYRGKYTSHEIQNEMIKVVALHIFMGVSQNIHGSAFYAIMADETRDMSNI